MSENTCMFDCDPPKVREQRVVPDYPIKLVGNFEIREDGKLYHHGEKTSSPSGCWVARTSFDGLDGVLLTPYSRTDKRGHAIGDVLMKHGNTPNEWWSLNKREYVAPENVEKMVKAIRKKNAKALK